MKGVLQRGSLSQGSEKERLHKKDRIKKVEEWLHQEKQDVE